MKIKIKDLTTNGLYAFVEKLGEKKYRASQILTWIYKKNIGSFDEMTNISKSLRKRFFEEATIEIFDSIEKTESSDGLIKYKFTLFDGEKIESVLIPEKNKATLCVSTQVGCKFGCKICRTGQMGFRRNLSPGEIIEQIVATRRNQSEDSGISNLVFMGMGEPLDNYENLKQALTIIIDEEALDFFPRHITVSTVGFLPALLRLGEDFPGIGLAISMNASDNITRDSIIPLNRKYPIEKLLDTLRRYPLKPRKIVTIEYVLIRGLNDSDKDAVKLAKLLKGLKCKINLIPYNEFDTAPYKSPVPKRVESFRMILINAGFTCITRKSRGGDINAACGCLAVY